MFDDIIKIVTSSITPKDTSIILAEKNIKLYQKIIKKDKFSYLSFFIIFYYYSIFISINKK